MIHFFLCWSRATQTLRLSRWYPDPSFKSTYTLRERERIVKKVGAAITDSRLRTNILETEGLHIVWRRYAGLYFLVGIDMSDNEIEHLELIQQLVILLDSYFGQVTELDLIFNFIKAYYIVDEVLLNGWMQEPSKREVLNQVRRQDEIVDMTIKASISDSLMGTRTT